MTEILVPAAPRSPRCSGWQRPPSSPSRPASPSCPSSPASPCRRPGFEPGDRLAVLVILVADDERTLRRLRPIVRRVYGLAHDLTERQAFAVAEGLRPLRPSRMTARSSPCW